MATPTFLLSAHSVIRGAASGITTALLYTPNPPTPPARATSSSNVSPAAVVSKLGFLPLLVGRRRAIGLFASGFVLVLLCARWISAPPPATPAPVADDASPVSASERPATWPKSIQILRRPSPAAKLRSPEYQAPPEEEAMFGEYQAVGLGSESLVDAYAPVLRKFVAPPKGDIFSTFGAVMTSNRSHAPALGRFLDSMVKFCSDCNRAKMLVIVPSMDLGAFTEIRNKMDQQLPKLELVPFNKIFPAFNKELEGNTYGWPRGWSGREEDKFVNQTNVPMYQSLQKLYGCLHLAREYCTLLDSNGFFVRNTTIADIYGGFRKSPYFMYSSYFRHRHPATQAAAKILGYEEEWGWTLEEHNWSVDTNILAELERLIHFARPALDNLESELSLEALYWIHLLHNRPRFRVFDTANLFGFQAVDGMRRLGILEGNRYTPWEDLWWYLERDTKLMDTAVKIINKHKFKMFRPSHVMSSVTLLERAAPIVMCAGEQPDKVYDLAMQGVFNKGGEQMEKEVEDSLKR